MPNQCERSPSMEGTFQSVAALALGEWHCLSAPTAGRRA